MKKKVLKTIYSLGGFKPFHFLNRKEALILTYHRFSDQSSPTAISSSEFSQHIEYLKENTNVVSLDELVEALISGTKLEPNSTVITIDDGYRDSYEIAYPLLKEHGVPATLFSITGFLSGKIWLWTDLMRFILQKTDRSEIDIEFAGSKNVKDALGDARSRAELAEKLNACLKRLPEEEKTLKIQEISRLLGVDVPETPPAAYQAISWDQAREMDRNGVRIESHTVTHPILTNIDSKQLTRELKDSKTELSERLGREMIHFCYPNGTFDRRVRNAVENLGYQSAVSTSYGFCDADTDRYGLYRIDGQPSIANFAQSVSGFEKIREKIGI